MAEAAEPSPERENTYVIDAENAAEMARLMRQEQIVTAGMGGIFPEQSDLSEMHHVLDLACGPGGWALEVAYTYKDLQSFTIGRASFKINARGFTQAYACLR